MKGVVAIVVAVVVALALAGTARGEHQIQYLSLQNGAVPVYLTTNGINGGNGPLYTAMTYSNALPVIMTGGEGMVSNMLLKTGGTMSGALDMGSNAVLNAYRMTISGPTQTYNVTRSTWPSGAAVASTTNHGGTLANDTDVFAFVVTVWPATNIGSAWLFGSPLSNRFAGAGTGTTNDFNLVASWTNYTGMHYWLSLTNASKSGAALYTNTAATTFTFAGVAGYDATLDTSRTLYVVTNAADTALVVGGAINMRGNTITNLANPATAGSAANKAYVDAATNALHILTNAVATRAYVDLSDASFADWISIPIGSAGSSVSLTDLGFGYYCYRMREGQNDYVFARINHYSLNVCTAIYRVVVYTHPLDYGLSYLLQWNQRAYTNGHVNAGAVVNQVTVGTVGITYRVAHVTNTLPANSINTFTVQRTSGDGGDTATNQLDVIGLQYKIIR